MKKLLATVALLGAAYGAPAAAIVTTSSSSGLALAQSLAGNGFNIVNASLTTDTQNGFFTDGAAGTGIAQGVVLTTGSLGCVASSNTQNGCSGSGAGSTLSVNFTLDGDQLFFNYVFASEEYNEYVNSYNDSFQLLLDGVNIAKLPNGQDVSINNVNLNVNSQYYRNNGWDGPSLNLPIEFDGLTTVLTASATGLTAGVHNLSFVISDQGDTSYDSAVFIQGGTVGNTVTPVPEPAMIGLFGFGALGLGLTRRRKAA